MYIEHIAMYVNDLEKTKEFFIKYLGAKSNNIYHNKKTDFKSYFLSFDSGCRLEIMTKPEDGYYESCIVGIEGNQIEITI